MNRKSYDLSFQKLLTKRTVFMGIIVAATFTSCNKNSEELATEAQTTTANVENLRKVSLEVRKSLMKEKTD